MNQIKKGGARILVVDDEPDVCQFVESYFGRRNMKVSTTASGAEALFLIKDFKPDIILLDHLLEDITGLEVLKRLRKTDKDLPVVVISGCEFTEEKEQEIRDLGITEFLHKPLILEELAEVIYSVLDHRPLPDLDKMRSSRRKRVQSSKGSLSHKLSNLVGIIRNKCENFAWNYEDKIYADKTDRELVEMSVGIMKEIIETVDRTTEVIEDVKKIEPK